MRQVFSGGGPKRRLTAGKYRLTLFLLILLPLFSLSAYAQTITVSGTVSDNTGTLPGAIIAIKGTSTGVSSDVRGAVYP